MWHLQSAVFTDNFLLLHYLYSCFSIVNFSEGGTGKAISREDCRNLALVEIVLNLPGNMIRINNNNNNKKIFLFSVSVFFMVSSDHIQLYLEKSFFFKVKFQINFCVAEYQHFFTCFPAFHLLSSWKIEQLLLLQNYS